ncbi:MAG: hypothetical protein U0V73_09395 [Acidimicrobiia bacterium]
MDDVPSVALPALLGRQKASWDALVEIGPELGEHWVLVGGQMVYLHEVEHGARDIRPTVDVDVVVDLRVEPGALRRVNAVLTGAGFEQDPPAPDGIAHRYRRGDATIDVLAPDNLGPRTSLSLGLGRTIQATGATQAIARSSVVRAELTDGGAVEVRRPTLLGKIAAVTEIVSQSPAERAKHLLDVDALARLMGPADRADATLTKHERRSLRKLLATDHLSPLAEAALNLLAGGS